MHGLNQCVVLCMISIGITACSSYTYQDNLTSLPSPEYANAHPANYAGRVPSTISTGEKTIVVNPQVHVWAAYGSNGSLVRAGLATAGSGWCPDIQRECRTEVGSFRIQSLGSAGCKSKSFPVPRGGAPMPYCMYFNGGQALHGVPRGEVVEGNISHGCVRMSVGDAEWLRFNFANVGTKVVIQPY